MVSSVLLSYFGLAILGAIPGDIAEDTMSTTSRRLDPVCFLYSERGDRDDLRNRGDRRGRDLYADHAGVHRGKQHSDQRYGTCRCHVFRSHLNRDFHQKGLSNYKLALILTISQAVGALSGALLAVAAAESAGVTGEGLMRAGLGLILLLIAVYFLIGGKKIENPTVTTVDRFTGGLDWTVRIMKSPREGQKATG
jgi:hypothetical protein